MIEVIGPEGKVHYRRPDGDPIEQEALRTPGYSVRHVKEVEELVAMGGKFYEIEGISFCDTPAHTWQLHRGVGYVRLD